MIEDLDKALRGDLGYRGVEPSVAAGLFRLGLITEQQAREAAEEWQEDWDRAWDDSEWWFKTAELAWFNSASFLRRVLWAGIAPFSWKRAWIREHRGW